MKSRAQSIEKIARLIEEFFSQGITVDSETSHFLEAGLGLSSAKDIERFFLSDEVGDSGIPELIFSPGEDFRSTIEPHIPLNGLTAHDIDYLKAVLRQTTSRVCLSFPVYALSFDYLLSKERLHTFIDKLYLRQEISSIFSGINMRRDTRIIDLRIMTRIERYERSIERDNFLRELVSFIIKDASTDRKSSAEAYALVLRLFRGPDEGSGPVADLYEEKLFAEKRLSDHARFEQALTRYSMDILMAQRAAPPAESIIDLENTIRTIDYILHLIGEK